MQRHIIVLKTYSKHSNILGCKFISLQRCPVFWIDPCDLQAQLCCENDQKLVLFLVGWIICWIILGVTSVEVKLFITYQSYSCSVVVEVCLVKLFPVQKVLHSVHIVHRRSEYLSNHDNVLCLILNHFRNALTPLSVVCRLTKKKTTDSFLLNLPPFF